jgi:hypothetical protein
MDPAVIAFQGMIQDALGDRGRPVSAIYGEKVLSMVPGRRVHLAAVLRGRPDPELRASMEAAVVAIESRWGSVLDAWSGDPGEIAGLVQHLAPVVDRTARHGPGEVANPMMVRGVFPVTAVDFEGGHARYKVAVYSSGFLAVSGGFLELTFGEDLLRLEGAQPSHALTDEGTVRLGTIPAGEETSVACLLEPLSPGRHLVEGTLSWFDEKGNPRHIELPPREFPVLFPGISLEVPVAAGDGDQSEGTDQALRSWRFPASLGGMDVLRTARTVLGTRGMVLSAGDEANGPPPTWSVEGRALAGRTPLVLGLQVTGGDVRRLELRAASTDGAVTAGAVAEMRKMLTDAFFKRWRGQVVLEEEVEVSRRERDLPDTDIDIYVPVR